VADQPDVLKKFAKKLRGRAKHLREQADKARLDSDSHGYEIDYWYARAAEAESIADWARDGGSL
jgi:hypothetical protein